METGRSSSRILYGNMELSTCTLECFFQNKLFPPKYSVLKLLIPTVAVVSDCNET